MKTATAKEENNDSQEVVDSIQEHEDEKSFDAAFDEEADNEGASAEKSGENEGKKSTPKRDANGKFVSDKSEEEEYTSGDEGDEDEEGEEDEAGSGDTGEGEEEEEEEGSATEKLNKMAGEADDTSQKGGENKTDSQPSSQAKREPVVIDDKFIDNALASINDEQEREQSNSFLGEFPEQRPLLKAMFGQLASMLNGDTPVQTDQGQGADSSQSGDQSTQQNQGPQQPDPETARASFLYQLEKKHNGAIQVAESQEFQSWLDNQPAGVQKLADSGDVDVSVTVIQAYQEQKAKKAAKNHDEGKSGKRSKKNDLFKSTAKPKKTTSAGSSESSSDDDFDASFDEFADKVS